MPPACPERFREDEEHWRLTTETRIRDATHGAPHSAYAGAPYDETSDLSLALAIDMLWPCNWNFSGNLALVLGAIGGDLHPERPFAFCSRNIKLSPLRERMRSVCAALWGFCGAEDGRDEPEAELRRRLGERSDAKRWLAASLEKTIRVQLDL